MRFRRYTSILTVVAALGVPAAADDTASATIAPAAVTDADSTFSFAVIPDTQNETYAGEVRMQERVEWLLANRQSLDLRWVLHSGDVHNWDTPDHAQFAAMSAWLRPLETAGLPMILTPGNHDTAAVCPGGSACPGQDASVGLRNTSTWNAYYPPARFGFNGVFEAGKSDNGWRAFSAGGKDWLVLSLELWPRSGVINWARQVVAGHPNHNVIVVTHAFLEGDGRLSTSNGGYGANSPATLWDALDDYPNVVMTFSGHVGQAANTSLTGVDGHRVATFLQAFHDPSLNPTRIVTVDTAAGTISTRIVANYNRTTKTNVDFEYAGYRATISNMRFVGAPSGPRDDVLLRYGSGLSWSWDVGVATGSGFAQAGNWYWGRGGTAEPVYIGDFNGDGRDDVMLRYNNGQIWDVAFSTGSGFTPAGNWYWARGGTAEPVYIGDFNGDGRDDVMLRYNNGLNYLWDVAFSTGSGFTPAGNWYWARGGTAEPVYIGDFNGDGRDDVMLRYNNGQIWDVAFSTGSGFTPAGNWYWARGGTAEPVYIGDFNGDGRDDVMLRYNNGQIWDVAFSTGSGFTPAGNWYWARGGTAEPVYIGDFNGDGRDDVMLRYNNGQIWDVAFSTGSGFTPVGNWYWARGGTAEPVYVGNFA